ncbi:hypothetical protein RRIM16_04225 [Rickettsia conorii subsp. raoultii]|nr:hypothetical protein RRIM16_04225 [Rickettsia conorii subsp. raoultii]
MVGILKRIAVVDLHKNNKSSPIVFINPDITYFSEEKQTFIEGSLSFPGIEASITRSKAAAKIVPIDSHNNIEIAKIAALRLRKLAKEINLQPSDLEVWLNYKNEGKK